MFSALFLSFLLGTRRGASALDQLLRARAWCSGSTSDSDLTTYEQTELKATMEIIMSSPPPVSIVDAEENVTDEDSPTEGACPHIEIAFGIETRKLEMQKKYKSAIAWSVANASTPAKRRKVSQASMKNGCAMLIKTSSYNPRRAGPVALCFLDHSSACIAHMEAAGRTIIF